MTKQVTFDRAKLNRLKAKVKSLEGQDRMETVFTFDGDEFVLAYAQYLIEYLEGKL